MISPVLLALALAADPVAATGGIDIGADDTFTSAFATNLGEVMGGASDVVLSRETLTADPGALIVDAVQRERGARYTLTGGEEAEEVGFLETHFPLTVDDDLHPEIEENLIPLIVMEFFFGLYGGPLWIHKIMLKDPDVLDDSYSDDALWYWLIQAITLALNYALIFPAALVFGIGAPIMAIIFVVRAVYIYPVGWINLMNRHATGGGKKKRKKSRATVREVPQSGLAFSY